MIDIMHRGQNHVAFHSMVDPKIGDAVVTSQCALLDGTIPKDGEPIICGTCHEHLGMMDFFPRGA